MTARRPRPDYRFIAGIAIRFLPLIALRWLPEGKREGQEWVARNPTRADRHAGSFKINLRTGKWADFASGDNGGDVISLAAYLHGLSQSAAAVKVSEMLGLASSGNRR